MSGLLSHRFVSAVADGPDASQVQPSNWNDTHVFSGGNHGAIPLRDTGDAVYGGSWLASVAAGQVLVSNGVGALPSWTASPVIGGVLTVNGFGIHSFNGGAGGDGTNALAVHNLVNGASAAAALSMDNNLRAGNLTLRSYGSSFVDPYVPGDGVLLRSNGGGGLAISAQHAGGAINFHTGGTTKQWAIEPAGHLIPKGTGLNIGSLTEMVNRIHLGQVNGIYAPNLAADTGTALVLNAGGYVQKLTSSARDKERVAPWVVPADALTRFVALAPQLWDYCGQQNGAGGFLAEDLDALAIPNPYGRSVLINYDADGRPASNRDYALIALQHLVLQQHAARLAALEAAR